MRRSHVHVGDIVVRTNDPLRDPLIVVAVPKRGRITLDYLISLNTLKERYPARALERFSAAERRSQAEYYRSRAEALWDAGLDRASRIHASAAAQLGD